MIKRRISQIQQQQGWPTAHEALILPPGDGGANNSNTLAVALRMDANRVQRAPRDAKGARCAARIREKWARRAGVRSWATRRTFHARAYTV